MRARTTSRSTIRQPNAATTNSAWKMSSMPMREDTKVVPSQINSRPAMAPIMVERVIRRVIRITSSTSRVPKVAAANRQPRGV